LLAATEQAYNYAGGNPTNATDPTGLCDQEHPVDCFQEMEAGGAGEVTTGKGVRIGPNGTSTYEEHWDYSSGEPISARTTSASSVAPPDFWKKFIDLLTGKVANGTTRVTSSELQDFTSGMQNGSCQLGYNGNRANFWKGTVRSVLDEAPKDSANLANCPGCSNPIGRGNIIRGGQSRRDFDIDHSDIIWANRTAQIPSSTSRSVVIELYNFALRALCPDCNQSHRMEP
jgi:hypothetical protein